MYGCKQWRSHWEFGGQSATPDSEKIAKNREKEGKNLEKSRKKEKSGRKGKKQEGSFTLPLLTDRAGYATGCKICVLPVLGQYKEKNNQLSVFDDVMILISILE